MLIPPPPLSLIYKYICIFCLDISFRIPIERGLPSDATDRDKLRSMELQSELNKKLEPYVDRKGPNVLRKILPPIYDNVLELRPSPIQERLIKLEANLRKDNMKTKNFLRYVLYIALVFLLFI